MRTMRGHFLLVTNMYKIQRRIKKFEHKGIVDVVKLLCQVWPVKRKWTNPLIPLLAVGGDDAKLLDTRGLLAEGSRRIISRPKASWGTSIHSRERKKRGGLRKVVIRKGGSSAFWKCKSGSTKKHDFRR